MLKYESKEQAKSSKINNSKEDLIEESEQKMKIELKNIIFYVLVFYMEQD